MKLIFLDIDGVLNTDESGGRHIHFLPEKARMVHDLAVKRGAEIVISSTWRKLYSLDELRAIFTATCRCKQILTTTPITQEAHRGAEIEMLVSECKPETYVIFDDSIDMYDYQLDNFVHVNHLTGLTVDDIRKANKILKGKAAVEARDA